MEERIIELEMQYMHLERTVKALDQIVLEERSRLDAMERKLAQALSALRSLTQQMSELGREEE